jgi:hypothetical protein
MKGEEFLEAMRFEVSGLLIALVSLEGRLGGESPVEGLLADHSSETILHAIAISGASLAVEARGMLESLDELMPAYMASVRWDE